MRFSTRIISFIVCIAPALIVVAGKLDACSICSGFQQTLTLREEALLPRAKIILVAKLKNSTLLKDGRGFSELQVQRVFRKPADVDLGRTIRLEQYLPAAEGQQPEFLIFADIRGGKVEPFRGLAVQGPDILEYLSMVLAATETDPVAFLEKVSPFLESPGKDVSQDAFLEFAKARDAVIAKVSRKMNPALLRSWIMDSRVPEDRLGLYAYLLGGCGGKEDFAFLEGILGSTGKRSSAAYDGAMIALLRLQPERGWPAMYGLLEKQDTPLQLRLACFRSLKAMAELADSPEEKNKVNKGYQVAWHQGELADLSVEELRKAKQWVYTNEILARYGAPGYEAPVVKRAILRYALSAPASPALSQFLDERNKREPSVLEDVRESLGLVPVGK